MIFVTGGTGLLGARLLYDLALDGQHIRALKRVSSSLKPFEYWIRNEPHLAKQIEWVTGDLLDIDSLESALKDVTQVYHCGAMISTSGRDHDLMEKINVQGTANLVNLCLDLPALQHFCHVSSVAALGREPGEEIYDENSHWQPGKHNSHYAISKYGAEREVWRAIAEGLPAVIVNPSVIIGPGNWNLGSCRLFPMVKKGWKFFTEGINGYVDVRDVSSIMRELAKRKITSERYILNAENISYRDFFMWMSESLHAPKPSFLVKPWMAEIAWRMALLRSLLSGKSTLISKNYARVSQRATRYSNHKIKSFLNFEFIPVQKSIEYTAKAYLNQHS
jgi:nucleoside-diphosphate-sugar epimerase